MKKQVLDMLSGAEGEAAERIARLGAPGEERDRIFAMSERKAEIMKNNNNINIKETQENKVERTDVIDIKSRQRVRGFAHAAAACLAVAVIGASAFGIMKLRSGEATPAGNDAKGATTVKPEAGEYLDGNYSALPFVTPDTAEKTEQRAESTASAEVSSKSGKRKPADDTGSDGRLGAPESKPDDKPDDSEISASEYEGEEDASTGAEDPSEIIDDENGDESKNSEFTPTGGRITKEMLLSVTPDMTYSQIRKSFGEPVWWVEMVMPDSGYLEYIVEPENKLVMLFYDDENEKIGRSGTELYNYPGCPLFGNMTFDAQNRVTDCFVVNIGRNESGDIQSILVRCPWNTVFDLAGLRLTEEQLEYLNSKDVQRGAQLRIKYRDEIEESYPYGVYAEEVQIMYYQ